MGNNESETPQAEGEFFSARSRSSSFGSQVSNVSAALAAALAPIKGSEGKFSISVSCNQKREFKDKRIYVNPRTGLPIRPPTSFGLFMHAMRRGIKNDKVSFLEFHKKATRQWMRMGEEEKEPYVERAKILAEQYKKIEVLYLRKKVRQMQKDAKEERQARINDHQDDYYSDDYSEDEHDDHQAAGTSGGSSRRRY